MAPWSYPHHILDQYVNVPEFDVLHHEQDAQAIEHISVEDFNAPSAPDTSAKSGLRPGASLLSRQATARFSRKCAG